MKKLKIWLALYMLFVYIQYIRDEDFDIYTKFTKIILYPAWVVKGILAWVYSIVCFPLVLLHWFYVWIEYFFEKILIESGFYEKITKMME